MTIVSECLPHFVILASVYQIRTIKRLTYCHHWCSHRLHVFCVIKFPQLKKFQQRLSCLQSSPCTLPVFRVLASLVQTLSLIFTPWACCLACSPWFAPGPQGFCSPHSSPACPLSSDKVTLILFNSSHHIPSHRLQELSLVFLCERLFSCLSPHHSFHSLTDNFQTSFLFCAFS